MSTHECRPGRAHAAGFTLIELMITVAIIAILASIAYPSYQSHVIKTHRAAAKACLSEMAQAMERHYTSNLTYVGAAPALGCTTEGGLDKRYTFSAPTNLTRSTYTLQAIPVSTSQQAKDTQCGTLSVNHLGVRDATGTLKGAGCW